jgi:hypothetical protein
MSNAVVTPLFPTGGRVRAWCVTSLAIRATSAGTASNVSLQEQFDALNFVDGYNLRIGAETASATDRIFFKFVTPMQDSAYRVFIQPRMNPMTEDLVNSNNTSLEQYRLCSVLNTSAVQKTKQGFWIRMGVSSISTWVNTQKIIRPDSVENRQSSTSNTSRKTIALSVVVL